MQEWKEGKGLIASMTPKFVPEADLSDCIDPKKPVMRLCAMTSDGNLQIPDSERKRWLADPVRSNLLDQSTFKLDNLQICWLVPFFLNHL